MFTEAFWMETIVNGLINAVAAIIAALIAYFAAANKTKHIIEEFPEKHKELSNDHKELSKEHRDLSKEYEQISKEQTNLLNEVLSYHKKVEALDNQKLLLEKQMPKETTLVDLAKEIYNVNASLNQTVQVLQNRNSELQMALDHEKEKNKILESRNLELQKEIAKKNHKRDYDDYGDR